MKIICIGRNYSEHARELNNDIPTEPVVFMKPDSALLRNNDPFYIPSFSQDVHYECELIVRINRLGKNIEPKFANRYYDEIGLGIDFTARDLQNKLKDKGLPWEKAKAFDRSAVISTDFIPKIELPDVNAIKFQLKKNGEVVQNGDSSFMLFPVDELISQVSNYFTLKIGDLIYTGTPAGVGPVAIGDRLEGFLEGRKMFDFRGEIVLPKSLKKTLSEYYNQIYNRTVAKIASGEEELDDRMSREPDEMGMILRLRPSAKVLARIEAFLEELRQFEPEQHYYPDSDIQVSVASLIIPNKAFQLSQIHKDEYIRSVRESVSTVKPFEIFFGGITASPGACQIYQLCRVLWLVACEQE